VRGEETAFRDRHPYAGEVALVVEVADTSLDTDRVKGKTYGRAGIPQYWIVNLVDRCIEIYTLPSEASERGYGSCSVMRAGEIALVIDGQPLAPIPVANILP
jgi:Uma2 family endonuclease